LYILGLIGYQGSLTFWTAAFPGLSRDLPEIRESEEKLARGEIEYVFSRSDDASNITDTPPRCSQRTHDTVDMLSRNRLANVSFFISSVGELVILAILAGILEGVITSDPDSNTKALSIVCAYSAGVWSELLDASNNVILLMGGSPVCDPMAGLRTVPSG